MTSGNTTTYSNYLKLVEQVENYALITMDTDGYIQDWNKGAEKIKGYTPEEIIGRNFRIFYPDKDRKNKKPDSLLMEARYHGSAKDEGWRVRKDGSHFWGSITITALFNDAGEHIGFGKITHDLTQKRAADLALQRQKEKLEAKNQELKSSEMRFRQMMLEVQDYAILLMDTEGNIQNWNYGATKIKGYSADEIIGKNFRKFYTREDRKAGKPDRLISIARTTGRAHEEGYRVRKDGSRFWGSITITAIHDDQGKLIGFSKVTRDLTERKAAEDLQKEHNRQLERKNQELERFAVTVSHDLQEPLYTIHTFLQVLDKEFAQNISIEGAEYMRYISDASQRMRLLVQDLLDYSRLGKNRQLTEIDCNDLLETAKMDLSANITEAKAQIESTDLPEIVGYQTELRLLFQNLLSNAIKFRRPGVSPHIRISAKKIDNYYQFTFRDNGIGVSSENQDKIFGIFQRLHPRSQYNGTGVGLAQCSKIVELHHGKIWLEPSAGEGSQFCFTILAD